MTVPLTEMGKSQAINIPLPMKSDLTGASVVFKVRAVGTGGGIQVAVQNGEPDFKSAGFEAANYKNVSDFTAAFTDITLNVDTSAAANTGFDKTMVTQLVVQIAAGMMGPWRNPTILYIDSITFTGGTQTLPAIEFMTDAMPATLSTYMPVTGSTLTHQGP